MMSGKAEARKSGGVEEGARFQTWARSSRERRSAGA